MVSNRKKLFITIFIFVAMFTAPFAYGGEIEYTGRATVLKDDVRSAQRNSLNNALLGGLRAYVRQNAPDNRGDITMDNIGFLNSYKILSREYTGGSVVTRVRLDIDDIILEDTVINVSTPANAAAFLFIGLPNYIDEAKLRPLVQAKFEEKQFTTKEQVAFEQELLDRTNYTDIQNALQSVSAEYLFIFQLGKISFKAGESCDVQASASYIASSALNQNMPIMSIDKNVLNESTNVADCVYGALESSVSDVLEHVRLKQIPAPGVPLELLTYKLSFSEFNDFVTANTIMSDISHRRYIANYAMESFFGNEIIFKLNTYLPIVDLAERLATLNQNIDVFYDDSGVMIKPKGDGN